MKQKQVLNIQTCGKHFSVIFKEGQTNPFFIYERTMEFNKYVYVTEHKRLCERYADMMSCLLWLANVPEFRKDVF